MLLLEPVQALVLTSEQAGSSLETSTLYLHFLWFQSLR